MNDLIAIKIVALGWFLLAVAYIVLTVWEAR
jgi:hypothetical protein